MEDTDITEHLDVRGIPCPRNYARILLRLEAMGPNTRLEVLIDDGEPYRNVTAAILDEGHCIESFTKGEAHWRLGVRRT